MIAAPLSEGDVLDVEQAARRMDPAAARAGLHPKPVEEALNCRVSTGHADRDRNRLVPGERRRSRRRERIQADIRRLREPLDLPQDERHLHVGGIAVARRVLADLPLSALQRACKELGDRELRLRVCDLRVQTRGLRALGRDEPEPATDQHQSDERGGDSADELRCEFDIHQRSTSGASTVALIVNWKALVSPTSARVLFWRVTPASAGTSASRCITRATSFCENAKPETVNDVGTLVGTGVPEVVGAGAAAVPTAMLRLESHDPDGSTRETSSRRSSHGIRAEAAALNAATRAWSLPWDAADLATVV